MSKDEALALNWCEFPLWIEETEKLEAERALRAIHIQHGNDDTLKDLQRRLASIITGEDAKPALSYEHLLLAEAVKRGDEKEAAEIRDTIRAQELMEAHRCRKTREQST